MSDNLVPVGGAPVSDLDLGPDEGLTEPLEPRLGHDLGSAPARVKRRRREWVQLLIDAVHYRRTQIGLVLFCIILAIVLIGPYVAPHSPYQFVVKPFAHPSSTAWFGGDSLGRDVLSRVLYGGRSVLGLAILATAIGLALGVSLGLLAGYARPAIDDVVMRLLDVAAGLPADRLRAAHGVGARAQALADRAHRRALARPPRGPRDARRHARDQGARLRQGRRSARRRPHQDRLRRDPAEHHRARCSSSSACASPTRSASIAALSFLGFGMQPPAADWGLMINENRLGSVHPALVDLDAGRCSSRSSRSASTWSPTACRAP